jgi:hypothetical protein
MAQIRVMSDGDNEVTELLDVLMPLLRAHPAFVAGSVTTLGKRGPGERKVFELMLADREGPRVTVERTDTPPRAARRQLPRR